MGPLLALCVLLPSACLCFELFAELVVGFVVKVVGVAASVGVRVVVVIVVVVVVVVVRTMGAGALAWVWVWFPYSLEWGDLALAGVW